NQKCNQQYQKSIEPVRLIEVGLKIELKGCPLLVPNTVVVCRNHSKRVRAGPEICIRRSSLCAGVNPIRIKSFQLIFELYFVGRYKTQGGVIKLQPRCRG